MDIQNMCAGLNYNMTPDQKIEALQIVCNEMEQQLKGMIKYVGQLSRWYHNHISNRSLGYKPAETFSTKELYGIILSITYSMMIQDANQHLLHFLAYNEYPIPKDEKERKDE